MEADRCRHNKLKCAVLDTNVLMYIFLKKIDVLAQLKELGFARIIVPESVVRELKNLEISLTGKERLAARFALKLIDEKGLEVVGSERKGDEALIDIAKRFGCYLITNDKMLRKRARAEGIAVGYLRELNRIEVLDF